jgi:hypothetical protein
MEIDACMNRFRLASRELFNHYFHESTHDEELWVMNERFTTLEEQMFNALVTEPADIAAIIYGKLQPGIAVGLRLGEFAPWMLNREIDSGYWDYPIQEFTQEVVLHFKEYFDWDQTDFKDYRYVRVVIAAWPSHPELIGKHALVESHHVRFTKA